MSSKGPPFGPEVLTPALLANFMGMLVFDKFEGLSGWVSWKGPAREVEWPYTIGGGGVSPVPDPPPPQTKVTIVGKKKIYNLTWKTFSGHYWCTNFGVGGWRFAAVGGWRLVVGGWCGLVVCGWQRLGGGWRLAVGGTIFWVPDPPSPPSNTSLEAAACAWILFATV